MRYLTTEDIQRMKDSVSCRSDTLSSSNGIYISEQKVSLDSTMKAIDSD